MTRPHSEEHEPWLVEAIDGRLRAGDERHAVLADCAVCGPLLADMEALRDGLDDAGRLEREVLAEAAAARGGDEAQRAAAQARAAIAQLAPRARASALRWLVPLAAAAVLVLAAYWITTHWRADAPGPGPSAPRPQLGDTSEWKLRSVARGAAGELVLAWEPIEGAYRYDVELLADEQAAEPLVVVRGLDEPTCTISRADAARLPARVVARLQPLDIANARMPVSSTSFALP